MAVRRKQKNPSKASTRHRGSSVTPVPQKPKKRRKSPAVPLAAGAPLPPARLSDQKIEPATTDGPPDFFEIMRVAQVMVYPKNESLTVLIAALMHSIDTLHVEATKPGPLPPRLLESLNSMRAGIQCLADLIDSEGFAPGVKVEDLRTVHPMVEQLMHDNVDHLEKKFGRDIAEQEFRSVFKSLGRRRGRPPHIPMPAVQQAKALHDEGWSYGEIGQKLGLSRQQVRAALEHHFPRTR